MYTFSQGERLNGERARLEDKSRGTPGIVTPLYPLANGYIDVRSGDNIEGGFKHPINSISSCVAFPHIQSIDSFARYSFTLPDLDADWMDRIHFEKGSSLTLIGVS
jgi:hypothetical protein